MVTIKTPVFKVEEKENLIEDIQSILSKDMAYTIWGIMIEKFNIPEDEVSQQKHFNLYLRIRYYLEKLVNEGRIKKGKLGRNNVYYKF